MVVIGDSNRWKRLLAFASIYLIWGSTYLAIRYGIESFAPYRMMGMRSLIAGSVLYLWGRRRTTERLSPAHWRSAFLLGALFFLGGHGCLAWAGKRIPSGVASLRGGAVAVRRSAPSGAGGTIVSRRIPLPQSSILSSGMNLLAGGTLLLLVGFLSGETPPSAEVSLRSLLAVSYLIVFGSIVGFVAYMWLLRVETASKVGTYAFVNPGIAGFLGWLAGGETLSGRILLATALMVSGVAILVTSKEEKTHDRAPVARTDTARE